MTMEQGGGGGWGFELWALGVSCLSKEGHRGPRVTSCRVSQAMAHLRATLSTRTGGCGRRLLVRTCLCRPYGPWAGQAACNAVRCYSAAGVSELGRAGGGWAFEPPGNGWFATPARRMQRWYFMEWGVCWFGFWNQIAYSTCPKSLGEKDCWSVRVGTCPSAHKCCFCPSASLPRRRRRCFTQNLSRDVEIRRVLTTTTDGGKIKQGPGVPDH